MTELDTLVQDAAAAFAHTASALTPAQAAPDTKNVVIDHGGYDEGSRTQGYNNITLTPYMTGLSTAAPADAFVWYDELIVSTQPIPAPGGTMVVTTAPRPPRGLVVQ